MIIYEGKIMEEKLLSIEEIAVELGCSYKTLCNWYAFKRAEPDNEYAKMLPDYVQLGVRRKRLWKASDLEKLKQFRDSIPRGRGGVLGKVTQVWYHNKKEKEDE